MKIFSHVLSFSILMCCSEDFSLAKEIANVNLAAKIGFLASPILLTKVYVSCILKVK